MVKGKFVAKINVKAEFSYDKEKSLRPYDELKEVWKNLAKTMEDFLKDEFFGDEFFSVSVEEIENEISNE